MDYENNVNCQWLISPENQNVANIQLWFSYFDTEPNDDQITVYDGAGMEDPVIGIFSGSEIPTHITSSGNELLVVFKTNELNTSNGWLAEYLAYSGPFCNPLTTYSDTTKMWFTDASGPYNYIDNSDCQWLISPQVDENDSIASMRLFFHQFDLATDDTLFVFDGDSPDAPVIEKLTGDQIPEQIESASNKIFLQFKTNDQNNATGWAAGYQSIMPVYCQDTLVLTETSGIIEDGSGDKRYSNFADCYWLVEPEDAEMITLTFEEFSLEYGYDQLRIYDASGNEPVLLVTYWGFQLPEPFTMQGNRMLIHFVSDYSQTFDGFKISYTSLEPYINEQQNQHFVILYPNPVKDQLTIQISPELLECKYSIQTITGELVEEDVFFNELNTVNTSELQRGIYCIKIVKDKELYFQEFIK